MPRPSTTTSRNRQQDTGPSNDDIYLEEDAEENASNIDEADEADDDEEEEDDGEENEQDSEVDERRKQHATNTSFNESIDDIGKWSSKKKKVKKVCRHFAYDVIKRISHTFEWEPEQFADLLIAMSRELGLNLPNIKRMIEATELGSPQLLLVLADNGINFATADVLSIFLRSSSNIPSYIKLVDDALEVGLFQLQDADVLTKVKHC